MGNDNSTVNPAGSCSIGEKIKLVRRANKLTQKKFAESLGIAQGFLCAIERGRKQPSETLLIALRHSYNLNRQWLYSETATSDRTSTPEPHAATRIPNMAPLVHGNAIPTETSAAFSAEEYITLPELPKNSFAIRYSGDFMAPTIRHGDIVVISPDETPTPGGIVLLTGQWNEPFLRRYRSKNGEIFYTADNSAYSPFKGNDSTRILGVVVSVWRRINI